MQGEGTMQVIGHAACCTATRCYATYFKAVFTSVAASHYKAMMHSIASVNQHSSAAHEWDVVQGARAQALQDFRCLGALDGNQLLLIQMVNGSFIAQRTELAQGTAQVVQVYQLTASVQYHVAV